MSLKMGSKYPAIYVVSRFPNLDLEIKKLLPHEVPLIVIPLSEDVKKNKKIPLSNEQLSLIQDAEVLVADCTFLSEILYKLPKTQFVQTTWAGVEMLASKVDKTKSINFKLTRYVDARFAELMSNYVIAQIINVEREFYTYRDNQKKHEWTRPILPHYRVLSDLTIGILGAGQFGSSVGSLLKKAGCRVIVFVRNKRASPSHAYDEATTELEYLFQQCDYLCSVLPSTCETTGLLDSDVLKRCKKKPVFMNIGRGNIIKSETIIKALQEGWISKAILDVTDTEPLPPDHHLWNTNEVYITPHIAGTVSVVNVAKCIAENYTRYVNGEPLLNEVDLIRGY